MKTSDRELLVELDKAHVWHPYTPMRQYIDEGDPIVAVSARGSRIYDRDERRARA